MTGLWRRCSEAGKSMSFEIRPKLKSWPSSFSRAGQIHCNLASPHFSSILVSAHSPICQNLFVTPKVSIHSTFRYIPRYVWGGGISNGPRCMLPAAGSEAMFYFCSISHTISKCAFVTYVVPCFLHLCFFWGGVLLKWSPNLVLKRCLVSLRQEACEMPFGENTVVSLRSA